MKDDLLETIYIQAGVTLLLCLALPLTRYIAAKITKRYISRIPGLELRSKVMLKYINSIINVTFIILIIIVWGVNPGNLLVALSSVFGVIGVAMFAQWSILSNVTSGFILFFSTPFKIGDVIRILDKDMPEEVTVEDIKAFSVILRTKDNELVIYPNNLILQKGVVVEIKKDNTHHSEK